MDTGRDTPSDAAATWSGDLLPTADEDDAAPPPPSPHAPRLAAAAAPAVSMQRHAAVAESVPVPRVTAPTLAQQWGTTELGPMHVFTRSDIFQALRLSAPICAEPLAAQLGVLEVTLCALQMHVQALVQYEHPRVAKTLVKAGLRTDDVDDDDNDDGDGGTHDADVVDAADAANACVRHQLQEMWREHVETHASLRRFAHEHVGALLDAVRALRSHLKVGTFFYALRDWRALVEDVMHAVTQDGLLVTSALLDTHAPRWLPTLVGALRQADVVLRWTEMAVTLLAQKAQAARLGVEAAWWQPWSRLLPLLTPSVRVTHPSAWEDATRATATARTDDGVAVAPPATTTATAPPPSVPHMPAPMWTHGPTRIPRRVPSSSCASSVASSPTPPPPPPKRARRAVVTRPASSPSPSPPPTTTRTPRNVHGINGRGRSRGRRGGQRTRTAALVVAAPPSALPPPPCRPAAPSPLVTKKVPSSPEPLPVVVYSYARRFVPLDASSAASRAAGLTTTPPRFPRLRP